MARISKFIALIAVIGLALSGCAAEATVEEGAVEQQEAFEAAERILGLEPDPERIETQVGDRTNTCIDALGRV